MSKIIQKIEQDQKAKLAKKIPMFKAGDTLKVYNIITEKDGEKVRTRTQLYQGVCIARKNAGINSSFTVRKISFGEGVERVFPLYSPLIEKIEVAAVGKVARGKLYYLRTRSGKSARIAEDRSEKANKSKVTIQE